MGEIPEGQNGKWSSHVTSLDPFGPHETCKKWQKYKNKLSMRNDDTCARNIVSEPVPCSLFFWGVGGGGATHWTTDMFIVSANIFGWSLSGQVWSDFSYLRPCLSLSLPEPCLPALGFALAVNCSPAITPQHYISTLYYYTSTIILHLNCFHLPHCPFSALGNAVPWSRCLYQVHRNDRAGIGWGGLATLAKFSRKYLFLRHGGKVDPGEY